MSPSCFSFFQICCLLAVCVCVCVWDPPSHQFLLHPPPPPHVRSSLPLPLPTCERRTRKRRQEAPALADFAALATPRCASLPPLFFRACLSVYVALPAASAVRAADVFGFAPRAVGVCLRDGVCTRSHTHPPVLASSPRGSPSLRSPTPPPFVFQLGRVVCATARCVVCVRLLFRFALSSTSFALPLCPRRQFTFSRESYVRSPPPDPSSPQPRLRRDALVAPSQPPLSSPRVYPESTGTPRSPSAPPSAVPDCASLPALHRRTGSLLLLSLAHDARCPDAATPPSEMNRRSQTELLRGRTNESLARSCIASHHVAVVRATVTH